VARSLRDFLQEDFSPAYLGLTHDARSHLNRFQRFLHSFYVQKFGYWPPPKYASSFPKALYKSMFYDFNNLYELLVDTQSGNDISSQGPASGGICVLQNVELFNKRHNFTALSHTLPLLPANPRKPTRSFSSASLDRKASKIQSSAGALATATNVLDVDAANSGIIQAYMHFEKSCSAKSSQREEKLTAIDARKVRWLLIYGTLQYLTSALRAPNGVRDTESPEYPLCCLVAGQSSWNSATPVSTPPAHTDASAPRMTDDYLLGAHYNPLSIQPDCHREDYLASQKPAWVDVTEMTSIPKVHIPSRTSSTRAFGLLPSLSIRGSRRNSLTLKPNSHCPILVYGYGDGLNQATTQACAQSMTSTGAAVDSQVDSTEESNIETSWLQPRAPPISSSDTKSNVDFRTHTRHRTPLLHTTQLDQLAPPASGGEINDSMSRSDSTSSMSSSIWTDGGSATSSKSSSNGERQLYYKASTSEHSGLLGGLVSVDGTRVSLEYPESQSPTKALAQGDIHPLFRTSPVQPSGFCFDFDTQQENQASPADLIGPVGVAISAPTSTSTISVGSSLGATSLASEMGIHVAQTSIAESAVTHDVNQRKKGRSSDIFSGLVMSSTELRDRYNSTMKRPDSSRTITSQYKEVFSSSRSSPLPPTVTKTSHATQSPSLRSHIWHDDTKDAKKQRRTSSLWRW
jgi:hypothetical protein